MLQALQLLGEALRVAGRDEDAVDAVADDVRVAGDVGGDDRRARGEGLGQDHPEALARERRRAEHVGVAQLPARARRSLTRPSASIVLERRRGRRA